MKKSHYQLMIYSAMAVLLIVALALVFKLRAADQSGQQTMLGLPISDRIGGDFILASTTGKSVDLQQLRGKVVLLTFGYANCTEVCPLGLMRLHEVIKTLGSDAGQLQVLFIAFDSEKDMSGLARYIKHFDPAIIGLSGSHAQIAEVATRYGVVYPKKNSTTGQASFEHNGYIYLIDQQGHVRSLYQNRTSVRDIVSDVRLLQKS